MITLYVNWKWILVYRNQLEWFLLVLVHLLFEYITYPLLVLGFGFESGLSFFFVWWGEMSYRDLGSRLVSSSIVDRGFIF